MTLNTKGLVLKHRNIGEKDIIVTLLTAEHGVIEASVRNAKSIKSKLNNCIQQFSFSDFVLYKGRSGYIVNEADIIESFYNLRTDIIKISLCCYFSDIISHIIHENEPSASVLSLTLNSLYLLCENIKDNDFVKTVFELKIMCLTGFMPALDSCCVCGKKTPIRGYFIFSEGSIACTNCNFMSDLAKAEFNSTVINCMRYIENSDIKRVFSFKADDKIILYLNNITEYYLIYHCGINFKTLDFYKSLLIGEKNGQNT